MEKTDRIVRINRFTVIVEVFNIPFSTILHHTKRTWEEYHMITSSDPEKVLDKNPTLFHHKSIRK